MRAGLVLALALLPPAAARTDEPGDFDHCVLALSRSPGWCAREGEPDDAPGPAGAGSFTGSGRSTTRAGPTGAGTAIARPSAARRPRWLTSRARPGSPGTRGAGTAAARASRPGPHSRWRAAPSAPWRRPPEFEGLDAPREVTASEVEAAFRKANPALGPDGVAVTCGGGRIAEVRICLTRDLRPRDCGADVRRDCPRPGALMEAPP